MRLQNKWFWVALACMGTTVATAQTYRINGYVLDDAGNLPNANIKEVGGRWLGVTDMQGHFDMRTDADSVEFSYIGYQSQRIASSQGKNIIIQLLPNAVVEEVTVSARYVNESIGKVPPKVQGNLMPYELPITLPKRLFRGNYRFIFQPVLENVSTGKAVRMKPLVLDGKKYNWTQRRMYDGHLEHDPLSPYIVVADKHVTDSSRIGLVYRDTVFVEHPKDVFALNIYKSYEDYSRVRKMDSLPDYIRGSINPLKFLKVSMSPQVITDSNYFPRPNRQFMDTEGNINLRYLIGQSRLNLNDSVNLAEMGRLEEELKMLDGEEGVTLQSFSITGIASPDGGYERNLALARERMRVALDYIVSRLSPQTRALIEVHSNAEVAPWDSLLPALRRDGHDSIASRIETILRQYPSDYYKQWKGVQALDGYKSLIAEVYLPRLRTARYKYTYSIYRNRTVPEIRRLYAEGKKLSEFEFWRLYRAEMDVRQKEAICRKALAEYPNFMMAANDLAVLLIRRGAADDTLLERFVSYKGDVPVAVKINHIIALLEAQRYADAYAVANSPMRKTPETRLICAFVNAMNGAMTAEDKALIEQTDVLNKVLIKLDEGDNKTALSSIIGMENLDARGYYVKAICCNRSNLSTMACESLKKALELDPKLENVARGDADVYEIYQRIKDGNE